MELSNKTSCDKALQTKKLATQNDKQCFSLFPFLINKFSKLGYYDNNY